MKYERFCIFCGKKTETLIENLCEGCYKKIKEKTKYFKKIKICKICKKIFYKNKEIEKIDKEKIDKKVTKIYYFICKKCKNIISRKYNTIFQIRNLKEENVEKIINFIQKNKDLIKDIKYYSENSLDIYLLLKKNTLKKYIKLFKNLNFKTKISKKIKSFDKQHSKKNFIITVLLTENF